MFWEKVPPYALKKLRHQTPVKMPKNVNTCIIRVVYGLQMSYILEKVFCFIQMLWFGTYQFNCN